jgi:hypothetical protein
VVSVPGYGKEMYCVSCEVRTEFIYVMYAALPMVMLEISYCTRVTSKCGDLALQVGGVSDETVK